MKRYVSFKKEEKEDADNGVDDGEDEEKWLVFTFDSKLKWWKWVTGSFHFDDELF